MPRRKADAVVPIRALADAEALAWLTSKAPVATSNAELARTWGWSPTKVSRRLKAWAADGKVMRDNGSLTVMAPPPAAVPAASVPVTSVVQEMSPPARPDAVASSPFGVRAVRVSRQRRWPSVRSDSS